ncbi:biosynthetic arginine decarboxylase [Bacterioplanoides sp.]|uniref:biosynthetic arginine decarboxylase n=1 Tax=Bacterioplanoides sp. TaxID=2066072 RepID=UPI003B00F952
MTKATSAAEHYNLPYWSEGYAQVNAAGELCIHPQADGSPGVNLNQLRQQLTTEGLRLPVLVRFPGILHHRVQSLVSAFQQARDELNYNGKFTPVYPIKVNQQQPVVEQLLAGQKLAGVERLGLEAGSKPELIAVLAQLGSNPGVVVCNGYKDSHFIRLALMAEKMGHQVFIVIEKLSELPLVLAEAQRLNVKPRLGIRARLATIGKGNWQNTGGEKSKFGLSAYQMLQVVEQLRAAGQLDYLQLLHFHLGSQLANIRDIQTGLGECSRIFAELIKLGVPVQWLDVGGGLGVDYEGTRSRSYCSMNYSMTEYARNVVAAFKDICDELGLAQAPNIITESGRAMTAHHALLLTEIIDSESPQEGLVNPPENDAPQALKALYQVFDQLCCNQGEAISPRSLVEIYHDVQHWLEDAQSGFALGMFSLPQRAQMEALYSRISRELKQRLNPGNRSHRELLDELYEKQADKVFVNFSLFQSLPDIWGINQIFPIVPLRGHHEPVRHRAVLQDITCDSDGRIDSYVDADGIETCLPLPTIEKGEPLAFFLVGAYQEILGDMHNLFGDTDSVDVVLDDRGEVQLQNPIQGDDIATVLDYVNFCPREIQQRLQQQVANAQLSEADKTLFSRELTDSLQAYTYLS